MIRINREELIKNKGNIKLDDNLIKRKEYLNKEKIIDLVLDLYLNDND